MAAINFQANNNKKSNGDLIKTTFKHWNSMKRDLALSDIAREEGRYDDAIRHELKYHKTALKMELALRAVQSGVLTLEEMTNKENE